MKMLKRKNLASQYKILMENTREMLIFFDFRGKIVDCNEQALRELGYGMEIFNLPVHAIFKKVFIYHEKQLMLDNKYQNNSAETFAYRKNQTCFPVELKVSFTNIGSVYTGLCSALNIIEKKDAELKLKNLQNELNNINQLSTEFMANVTHELKTPINGIVGFSNSLLCSELDAKQLEAVNIIKRCCINMSKIINDLLDYAKISNNILRIEQREFNFRNLIQHIIDFNKARIDEKGLKLMVDISCDIPEILVGDELRITQILNNLFSNAVKFTAVGHIGLEVSKIFEMDRTIELFFMIFDTGIGISLEDKDKLFRSFSQVDSSISRRFGGTGLGLSISKKLVESMGGAITLDSEKNKGSVFSFSIKLKLPDIIGHVPESGNTNQITDPGVKSEACSNNGLNVKSVSESNYFGMKLQEDNEAYPCKTSSKELVRSTAKELYIKLEKLCICIEMDNWEAAEELAFNIKSIIPKDHAEASKNALRLLLAIRKENHNDSLEILNTLMEGLRKEEHQ